MRDARRWVGGKNEGGDCVGAYSTTSATVLRSVYDRQELRGLSQTVVHGSGRGCLRCAACWMDGFLALSITLGGKPFCPSFSRPSNSLKNGEVSFGFHAKWAFPQTPLCRQHARPVDGSPACLCPLPVLVIIVSPSRYLVAGRGAWVPPP